MNLKILSGLLFIPFLLILTGCGGHDNNQQITESQSAISVTDYAGNRIVLESPARRIVALAPHLVENTFSAGAGDYLLAVVSHSDYPAEAKNLPLVGGYQKPSIEQIAAYKPDLVLAWESGNSVGTVNALKDLGINVYVDRTETLEGIAQTIEAIGVLAGSSEVANAASQSFLEELAVLRGRFADARKVTAFYQVWNDPIRTINGQHAISATIELCGGTNVYADLEMVSPTINIESVIKENPEAIIASGMADERPDWLDDWRQWQTLQAVQSEALFFVHPDHIQRHTLRILKAARTVCQQLDQLR